MCISHLHIAQLMKLHVACISNVELLACSVYITFIYKYCKLWEISLCLAFFSGFSVCYNFYYYYVDIDEHVHADIIDMENKMQRVWHNLSYMYECMKNLYINHDSRMHMTYTPNCTLSVFYLNYFCCSFFNINSI